MPLPRIHLFLIFLLSYFSVNAQLADSCKLQIGSNLSGPADWGSEWPFVNIMKFSRTWITHNDQWVDGGENLWDTQVLDQIPLDDNGYPLKLPVAIDGMEAPQIVLTVWANTESLVEGTYVLLYDGTGEIGFWGDAETISSAPGRMEVAVTPGIADIMAMEIRESEEGDHIRNIRFLLPGTENSAETNPWTQEWLHKLAPFHTLRFMDWGKTNNSRLQSWEQRPMVEDYTYTKSGIPYEWMIELCNAQRADPWICIPHAADDDYIREMARLFKSELDPELTIYVEYSNEMWNWIFDQTHYCFDNGDQNVPWPERIVPFIQNALDIWTEEFEGELDRLERVVGVQLAWQDVSNRIVFNMEPASFDAFSPAAYFGFSESGIAALENLGPNASPDDVIYWARQGMLNNSYEWTKMQYQSIAEQLDIPMIYYEGGQHLTPEPFGSEQAYNPALIAAQTHPKMYELYNEWFDSLRTFVKGDTPTLLMNFSFIGPTSGRYGSWGVLESQFHQDPPYNVNAPKYQALLDNIYDCSPITNLTHIDLSGISFEVFPNPSSGIINLRVEGLSDYSVEIYDHVGRQLKVIRNEPSFSLENSPSGIYYLRLRNESGQYLLSKKVVRQ